MPSIPDLIRTFQSGGLSHDELLARIDSTLAVDQASATQLADMLCEENTRFPLPPGVYEEVLQRIERRGATQFADGGEETRVQTGAPGMAGMASPPTTPSATPSTTPSTAPVPPADQAIAGAEQSKGVGDTLNGRFVLEECLGVGGMGTVYKALDLRKLEASDRKPYIAIKVLNVQFRGHPKSLIALQREARKAQTLAHRNIVTVYDFDRDGSVVYLTMEYLSGKSLNRVLRAPDFAGMPFAKALPIVTGMGRALSYAHERGFVHCDFKPANVFLTDSGEVKVIDFGIARVFQQPADDADPTVFDPGTLGGMTPAYASPEMFEHREPDPRDDIYALACVTYELLTGRHPYERLSANQARGAGLKPQRPKSLSRGQWRALRAALSFDRATRTPTVARFLADLGAERGGAMPMARLGAVSLAGVLVAGGVGYYAWRSRHPPDGQTQPPTQTAPAPVATQPAQPAPPQAPLRQEAKAERALSMQAVAPVLARVPCSLFSASAQEHALQVRGYVADRFGIKRLKDELEAVPGVQTLNLDVQPLGDDKCDVIKLIGPYWSGRRDGDALTTIRTRAPGAQLTEGTPLIVDITTPPYDTYVYVDYYMADGKVVHMVPSQRAKANQAPASYHATVGSLGDWVIAKPFGTELIVLLTTPAPLFDALRPEVESRQDYLRALERQLGPMAARHGDDHIGADVVQISTKAR
ncbi:protein kinase [Cupriavidus sp. SK-3]|uniref:serine/threonine-protein kinase n=1 Tax=Cupriavidus sp. SK-3 TaxID=1470558 RepID=UPI00044684F1|nr:serine/threonine-protein kinase [Cupriavidus sp. SK-3]KDP88706.1 protein kinase [Cupriavidus sp. SK-3]